MVPPDQRRNAALHGGLGERAVLALRQDALETERLRLHLRVERVEHQVPFIAVHPVAEPRLALNVTVGHAQDVGPQLTLAVFEVRNERRHQAGVVIIGPGDRRLKPRDCYALHVIPHGLGAVDGDPVQFEGLPRQAAPEARLDLVLWRHDHLIHESRATAPHFADLGPGGVPKVAARRLAKEPLRPGHVEGIEHPGWDTILGPLLSGDPLPSDVGWAHGS